MTSEIIPLMSDLETYVAFALVTAILAPIRERYGRTFLLSRLGFTIDGVDFGSDVVSLLDVAISPIIETLPHLGVPVLYGSGEDWRVPGFTSLLLDLRNQDLARFLPLLVESTPLFDPNAFLFLPLEWDLGRIARAADEARTQFDFEQTILSSGGAVYRWVESWFEILLRTKEVATLGYSQFPVERLEADTANLRAEPLKQPQSCWVCGEVLPDYRAASKHVESKHLRFLNAGLCVVCGFVTTDHQAIQAHVKGHVSEAVSVRKPP